jgi:hypothetical protein
MIAYYIISGIFIERIWRCVVPTLGRDPDAVIDAKYAVHLIIIITG